MRRGSQIEIMKRTKPPDLNGLLAMLVSSFIILSKGNPRS
jgi:hypothetical protein